MGIFSQTLPLPEIFLCTYSHEEMFIGGPLLWESLIQQASSQERFQTHPSEKEKKLQTVCNTQNLNMYYGLRRRDAHDLIRQLDAGVERKLPCNQNLDLIFSRVDPDLVNKSAGLRFQGTKTSCQHLSAQRFA